MAALLAKAVADSGYEDRGRELAQLAISRFGEAQLPVTMLNFILADRIADFYELAGQPGRLPPSESK